MNNTLKVNDKIITIKNNVVIYKLIIYNTNNDSYSVEDASATPRGIIYHKSMNSSTNENSFLFSEKDAKLKYPELFL